MLPSRYTVAVEEGVVREASERLARAARGAESAPRGWKALAVVLPVAAVLWVVLRDRSIAEARNSLPFDRSVVITDNLAGVGSPSDRFLAAAAHEDAAAHDADAHEDAEVSRGPRADWDPATPAPAERGRTSAPARPPARQAQLTSGKQACPSCELATAGFEQATESFEEERFGGTVTAPEERARVKLPVGTRLRVVLTDPVTTVADGAPVTAYPAADVMAEGRVIVPVWARVEGLAFASDLDNRARILFRALVLNGESVPIDGVGLSEGNEVGIPGKVVRKGSSKPKRGGSLVLRALGAGAGASLGGVTGVQTRRGSPTRSRRSDGA